MILFYINFVKSNQYYPIYFLQRVQHHPQMELPARRQNHHMPIQPRLKNAPSSANDHVFTMTYNQYIRRKIIILLRHREDNLITFEKVP